jgi:ATP-binding cassette subfamily B protein
MTEEEKGNRNLKIKDDEKRNSESKAESSETLDLETTNLYPVFLETISFLWKFIRKYIRRYIAGFLFTVSSAVLSAIIPALIKRGIEALEKGTTKDFIALVGISVAGAGVLRSILLYIGRIIIVRTGRLVERDIRNDVFRSVMFTKTHFFDREGTGKISSVIINDVENIRTMLGFGGMIIAHLMPVFAFSLIGEFLINYKLALVSLIPLIIITLSVVTFQKKIFILSENVQNKLSLISDFAQEKLSSIKIIKNFAIENNIEKKFENYCADYRKVNLLLAKERAKFDLANFFLAEVSLVIVLLVGGKMVIDGSITKGTLAGFIAYQLTLIWPAMAIGYLVTIIQKGISSLYRVKRIRDQEKEIENIEEIDFLNSNHNNKEKEKINQQETETITDKIPKTLFQTKNQNFKVRENGKMTEDTKDQKEKENYDIQIKNLSYGILKDVNLYIPFGSKVIIKGKTGSGKTTLLNLILRLYDPPENTIFLGGKDILAIPLFEYKSKISAVLQENFFFSTTIRENIKIGKDILVYYGVEDGNSSEEEEIKKYLEISNFRAEDFPNGLDEIVGEKGTKLSGGQKERLALARALIKKPKILILDDAFANVDVLTERRIISSLFKYIEGSGNEMTVLFATHRTANTDKFNISLTMENGKIKELIEIRKMKR